MRTRQDADTYRENAAANADSYEDGCVVAPASRQQDPLNAVGMRRVRDKLTTQVQGHRGQHSGVSSGSSRIPCASDEGSSASCLVRCRYEQRTADRQAGGMVDEGYPRTAAGVRVAVFIGRRRGAGHRSARKMWAQQALGDGRTVPLIRRCSLTLVHNPGASLGLGSGSLQADFAARRGGVRGDGGAGGATYRCAGQVCSRSRSPGVRQSDRSRGLCETVSSILGKVVDFLNYG